MMRPSSPGSSPSSFHLEQALERALSSPLPGRPAQRAAWPDGLPGRLDPIDAETYGPAAVLIALCLTADSVRFPLIRRPTGSRRHAGQISLPGGELEPGEEIVACALREAEEEVGLPACVVRVSGLLTPVPVAVSRYRIQPVVGVIAGQPLWRPEAEEVAEILLADPDRLLREGLCGAVHREREGRSFDAPAYVVPSGSGGDALVWGATAIILSEFLAVWKTVRSPDE